MLLQQITLERFVRFHVQRNFVYKSNTRASNQNGTADKGQNEIGHEISKPEYDPKGSLAPKQRTKGKGSKYHGDKQGLELTQGEYW